MRYPVTSWEGMSSTFLKKWGTNHKENSLLTNERWPFTSTPNEERNIFHIRPCIEKGFSLLKRTRNGLIRPLLHQRRITVGELQNWKPRLKDRASSIEHRVFTKILSMSLVGWSFPALVQISLFNAINFNTKLLYLIITLSLHKPWKKSLEWMNHLLCKEVKSLQKKRW